MRASRRMMILAALAVCALLAAGCEEEPKGTKSPEEVRDAVYDSVFALFAQGKITTRYGFAEWRDRIAAGLFSTVRTDSLSRSDSLYYGRLLFWSGRDKKAREVFENLRSGGDKRARRAFLELINMEIERGDPSVAEGMMTEFREIHPAGPKNEAALYEQCEDLGGRYIDKNRLDDAIRVYVDELNAVPFDARHSSFRLVSDLANACQEAGKLDICREQLLRCRDGFEKSIVVYADTVTYADSTGEDEDNTYLWYKQYIRICNQLLERIDLLGKPAPELEFIHVFNADSSFTLESLRGKVVVLDFWTTWCQGCTIGYEELRALYKEYHSRGLEVVGITSLQGSYTDAETGEVEEDISPEREIEIVSKYIEDNKLFWPCAVGKKSVFDNGYTVSVVPTFAVIDRDGNIQIIRSFMGELEQKRRIVERFL